jgi:hypothetical protein
MAKNQSGKKSQKNRVSDQGDTGMDSVDFMDQDDLNIQDESTGGQSRGGQRQSQGQQREGRSLQGGQQGQQGQQPDILASITPAFNEARRYIEGSPVRAAAIGAVAGGLLMTLFSTEKGRQFARMAYDYANPMVAKYAKDYISRAAGDLASNAISQH